MKNKKNLHLAIAIVIFMILKISLPTGDTGLTPAGGSALALFIATVYSWITIGTGWTSFCAIGLLAFTGIASAGQLWQLSFGNSIVVLVILISILSYAVQVTGVGKAVASRFVTVKFVEKRPYTFLFVFMLANLLVAYIMDVIPTTIVFTILAKNILEDLGYEREDKFSKILYLIVLWITCIGMAATPICHSLPILILGMVEAQMGISVTYVQYMMVGIPFSLLMFLMIFLYIRFLLKPDCAKFEHYNVEERRKQLPPITKRGKMVLIVYGLLILLWLLPDLMGGLAPTAAAYIKGLGTTLPALLAVTVLCVITVEGKPCVDYNEGVKNCPWSAIIFVAATLVFASVMSMETGGINVFLQTLILPVAQNFTSTVFVMAGLLLALITTNFLANGVAATIILGTFGQLLAATGSGYSVLMGFGILLSLFANTACMTPPASAGVPLILQDGYVKNGEVFKYSIGVVAAAFIVGVIILWPFAQMIF